MFANAFINFNPQTIQTAFISFYNTEEGKNCIKPIIDSCINKNLQDLIITHLNNNKDMIRTILNEHIKRAIDTNIMFLSTLDKELKSSGFSEKVMSAIESRIKNLDITEEVESAVEEHHNIDEVLSEVLDEKIRDSDIDDAVRENINDALSNGEVDVEAIAKEDVHDQVYQFLRDNRDGINECITEAFNEIISEPTNESHIIRLIRLAIEERIEKRKEIKAKQIPCQLLTTGENKECQQH